MLTYQPIPITVQAIEQIINILQSEPGVKAVTVSTLDGLPLTPPTTASTQMAAAAGFLLASAHQSSAMLGCKPGTAITVQAEDGCFLVCQVFKVNSVSLLLMAVFYQPFTYKRLFSRTIKAICHTLEA